MGPNHTPTLSQSLGERRQLARGSGTTPRRGSLFSDVQCKRLKSFGEAIADVGENVVAGLDLVSGFNGWVVSQTGGGGNETSDSVALG